MKLWTKPSIVLLAASQLRADVEEWPVCDSDATDGDTIPEVAGRACYWSYGKGRKTNGEYLDNIIKAGHGSVLEHCHWTFGLLGVSRSLSHELVRHRHLNFSQLSQRYVSDILEFVVPPGLPVAQIEEFNKFCQSAATTYKGLCAGLPDGKIGREVARAVLPNATATRIVVTANTRALRSMLALRGSVGADAEFRRLAVEWLQLMKKLAPNSFADMDVVDGCVTSENPKV